MTITLTKEQLDKFKKCNKLADLTRVFLHGYDKDLTADDEIKLKKIVSAVSWALFHYGIELIYECPELISAELMYKDSINAWFEEKDIVIKS